MWESHFSYYGEIRDPINKNNIIDYFNLFNKMIVTFYFNARQNFLLLITFIYKINFNKGLFVLAHTSNVMTPLSPYLSNILSMKYCSAGRVLFKSMSTVWRLAAESASTAKRTTAHDVNIVVTELACGSAPAPVSHNTINYRIRMARSIWYNAPRFGHAHATRANLFVYPWLSFEKYLLGSKMLDRRLTT